MPACRTGCRCPAPRGSPFATTLNAEAIFDVRRGVGQRSKRLLVRCEYRGGLSTAHLLEVLMFSFRRDQYPRWAGVRLVVGVTGVNACAPSLYRAVGRHIGIRRF